MDLDQRPSLSFDTPLPSSPSASSAESETSTSTSSSCDMDSAEVCFICLDSHSEARPLSHPCACPRAVHPSCMARWQLQSAGRSEETVCRFCSVQLPDWKHTLTPSDLKPADPIMVVTLGNVVHRIKVKPGQEGMKKFQLQIRELFQIPDHVEFEVTFKCKAPNTVLAGDTIQLEGMSSYDAATHCASLMAAQRLANSATAAAATTPIGGARTTCH